MENLKTFAAFCPYCGNQCAIEGRSIRHMEYKWFHLIREVKVLFCTRCGTEIPNPVNERIIAQEMQKDINEHYIACNYNRKELQKKLLEEDAKSKIRKHYCQMSLLKKQTAFSGGVIDEKDHYCDSW